MRASMADVVLIPVIILVMLVPIAVTFLVNNQLQQKMTEIGVPQKVFTKVSDSLNIILNSIMIVYFMLMIGAVVLAYYSPSHPAFFPFSVFFAVLGTLVAFITRYFLGQFLTQLGVSNLGSFPFILGYFLPYLPHLTVLFWIIMAVVMYGNIKAYREGVL